ncbi:hypothetical protein [Timonella senegalensis]|uniref:hypothetical protein n=1 Tax=Timonella senegalensis TaxID=1465825 RepID=UPI0028A8656D|nr:hypothetical protein [Timonella senegalensis]
MNWLEILGWIGSAVVVWSLLQTRILRLRVLNFIGCAISVVYALLGSVWPVLGLNLVLCVINIYHLRKLTAQKETERAYKVLTVTPQDAYLQFFLDQHTTDITEALPEFNREDTLNGEATEAHIVLHNDETVGIVVLRDAGAGEARVLLDYVTPRFRDFTPGKYLFRDSGLLHSRGFTSVVAPAPANSQTSKYYSALGFVPEGDTSRLAVAQ